MAGWHHWLDGRESEWTPGVGDGQGGLSCCDSWGRKESDTTEWLNWTELSIISGINPEERIYRPKKVTTIFCICNQPVGHLVPMVWHTAHWHLAGHKSHKSQGYYDEGIQCLVLLRLVILSLTGHHNLLGSFSKRKDARLIPESESQRMEPTFAYITFFLASPDTPVVSHWFRLWSWNTLTQNTRECGHTHRHTHLLW